MVTKLAAVKPPRKQRMVPVEQRDPSPKMVEFARLVASGTVTASTAYRKAYASNGGPATVAVAASKLRNEPRIAALITEIQEAAAARSSVTLESHLTALLVLRNEARTAGQFGVAVGAEVARGKASGVHVEKTEVLNLNRSLPATVDDFV